MGFVRVNISFLQPLLPHALLFFSHFSAHSLTLDPDTLYSLLDLAAHSPELTAFSQFLAYCLGIIVHTLTLHALVLESNWDH